MIKLLVPLMAPGGNIFSSGTKMQLSMELEKRLVKAGNAELTDATPTSQNAEEISEPESVGVPPSDKTAGSDAAMQNIKLGRGGVQAK